VSRARRIPPASKTPAPVVAPRLPTGRALRVVEALELVDDGVYTDLDISHGRLVNSAARHVTFERVRLRDTDLSHTRLERLVLADVRLEGCDLANGVWRNCSIDRAEFIECRLTGLDLAEASLRHVVMRQCGAALISLRFAELENSRFEDCVLAEADFQDAKLPGAIVRGSDLRGASLYGAHLHGADLRGSLVDDLRIRATDLAGAVIDPIQLVTLARTLASLLGVSVRDLLEDDGGRPGRAP